MTKRDEEGIRHRGPTAPDGSLTLDEASRLPGLAGWNHMTIRRALEPVCIGKWLPPGTRHWQLLFDAEKATEIGARRVEQGRAPPPRPPDKRVAVAPLAAPSLKWRPTTFGRYLPPEGYPEASVDLFFYFRIGDAPDRDWRGRTPTNAVIVEGTWVVGSALDVKRMVDEVMDSLWRSTGKSLKVRRVALYTWTAVALQALVAR